jgi:hypothetical protein
MFCPVCKSEYREGFTTCSDCGATLVPDFPDASTDIKPNSMEILWIGTDASLHSSLCERLDADGIFYEDHSVESHTLPPFRHLIYRIRVRVEDREAALHAAADLPAKVLDVVRSTSSLANLSNAWFRGAAITPRSALNKLLGQGVPMPESTPDIPANGQLPDYDGDSDEEVPDDQIEDFNADEATSEVWSGAEEQMAQNISDCLREVGVGCVVNETAENFNVYVERASETRAKEIIREIIEQTPPE